MEALKKNESISKVIVKKVISASQEDVFDAWTKPEIMNKWYVGGPGRAECVSDLKVGGKYTNNMLIGGESTCDAEGKPTADVNIKSYLHSGEYLEIKRPEKLVFTWNSPSVQNTRVTIDIQKVSNGTEVTITHELLPESQIQGHTGGWTFALDNLAKNLS